MLSASIQNSFTSQFKNRDNEIVMNLFISFILRFYQCNCTHIKNTFSFCSYIVENFKLLLSKMFTPANFDVMNACRKLN